MSASIEVGAHTTGDVPQDSEEFQTIVQSIEGVQDPEILFPSSTRSGELPTGEQGENTTITEEDGEGAKDQDGEKDIDNETSYYWDASTMAPLSSASAVSTYLCSWLRAGYVFPYSGAGCPVCHSGSSPGPGLHVALM